MSSVSASDSRANQLYCSGTDQTNGVDKSTSGDASSLNSISAPSLLPEPIGSSFGMAGEIAKLMMDADHARKRAAETSADAAAKTEDAADAKALSERREAATLKMFSGIVTGLATMGSGALSIAGGASDLSKASAAPSGVAQAGTAAGAAATNAGTAAGTGVSNSAASMGPYAGPAPATGGAASGQPSYAAWGKVTEGTGQLGASVLNFAASNAELRADQQEKLSKVSERAYGQLQRQMDAIDKTQTKIMDLLKEIGQGATDAQRAIAGHYV